MQPDFDSWWRQLVQVAEARGFPVNRRAAQAYGAHYDQGASPLEALTREAAHA